MLMRCTCGQMLKAPEGAEYVNCPCGNKMPVAEDPPAEPGSGGVASDAGRRPMWKVPGINAPAREGLASGVPGIDAPEPEPVRRRGSTARFDRPARGTSRFNRPTTEDGGPRTSRFGPPRTSSPYSDSAVDVPAPRSSRFTGRSRTPLDPPSDRLGGDLEDIDWSQRESLSRGTRRGSSVAGRSSTVKTTASLAGERLAWAGNVFFIALLGVVAVSAIGFFYDLFDASREGQARSAMVGSGVIVFIGLLSFFIGRFVSELGKVTRSNHKMSREMKSAASGYDVYRSFYRTDRLVFAGQALFVLSLLVVTGLAVGGTIGVIKSGGGKLAIGGILVTMFGCLMLYLLGMYALQSAQVNAQISKELQAAMESFDSKE